MNMKSMIITAGLFFVAWVSPLTAEETVQSVTPGQDSFSVLPGEHIEVPLIYSADSANMTGVGISLTFDDQKLEFTGFSNTFEDGLIAADKAAKTISKVAETEKENAQASLAWMTVDGTWPGEGNLPMTLAVAHFNVLDSDADTEIKIRGEAAAKSVVPEQSVAVTIWQGNLQAMNGTKGGGSMSWLFLPMFMVLVLKITHQYSK